MFVVDGRPAVLAKEDTVSSLRTLALLVRSLVSTRRIVCSISLLDAFFESGDAEARFADARVSLGRLFKRAGFKDGVSAWRRVLVGCQ